MKIVITAPSLDEHRNVSGISTIVRQIIAHSGHKYAHFKAGRADGEKAGAGWMLKQAALPVRFFARILKEKADVIHINTALTDLSIWRDAALTRAAKMAGLPGCSVDTRRQVPDERFCRPAARKGYRKHAPVGKSGGRLQRA